MSKDHQKTQKFKGVPSFAVEFRTVFRDINQDHVSAVSAYDGQDDNVDDNDDDVKKDEIDKLNRETERRREDRLEKRRRAIENDPTIRINELMLLNEMSRSMLNALYTNGCVRTIRGVHRSIFLNDVVNWLCGVEIDRYVVFECGVRARCSSVVFERDYFHIFMFQLRHKNITHITQSQ